MPKALLICSPDDCALMGPVVHELRRVGIIAMINIYDRNSTDVYDVACIFWCKHASVAKLEDSCCELLNRAQRALVVHLDDSQLPEPVRELPRVRLSEAAHLASEETHAHLPEWQENIKLFLPDIVFDPMEMKRQLRHGVADLRSWIREPGIGRNEWLEDLRITRTGIAAVLSAACLLA